MNKKANPLTTIGKVLDLGNGVHLIPTNGSPSEVCRALLKSQTWRYTGPAKDFTLTERALFRGTEGWYGLATVVSTQAWADESARLAVTPPVSTAQAEQQVIVDRAAALKAARSANAAKARAAKAAKAAKAAPAPAPAPADLQAIIAKAVAVAVASAMSQHA